MEVQFKDREPIEIDLAAIKSYITKKLQLANADSSDEAICHAFKINPLYYLIHLNYFNMDDSFEDNQFIINAIVDKFFLFVMHQVTDCFYVVRNDDGSIIDKFDSKEMADTYAAQIDGYVMLVP